MILVVDNYDSFTFNLVQVLSRLDPEVVVVRNDSLSVDELLQKHPARIVISPGPGRPKDAGVSCDLIRRCGEIPLLGVCLGHQAIGLVFGGSVVRASAPMHGKVSQIAHLGTGIFEGLSNPFQATRYHSLVVDAASVPPELEVTARTGEIVMALRHRTRPIVGVQFHPESILTTEGERILRNFVRGSL
jgi:anthranilate synthase component 2